MRVHEDQGGVRNSFSMADDLSVVTYLGKSRGANTHRLTYISYLFVRRSMQVEVISPVGGYILKCSPRYTRRTEASLMMASGTPLVSTLPSLMM